jgi:hypothetical protein
MSTHADHILTARAIRVGPAAAAGVALLVIGLAVGLVVGRLQAGAGQATPAPAAVAAPAANVPALSWRDDFATRHPLAAATQAQPLSWRDDYATRHPLAATKAPALSWRDDYGTRHPGALR